VISATLREGEGTQCRLPVAREADRSRRPATVDRPDRVIPDVTTLSASEGAPTEGAYPESTAGFAARCGLDLLRFAYLLCGDRQRAEDLMQDVLLAMSRRFGESLPLDNPLGYARRALANANVSRARRAASSELPVDVLPDAASAPADDPAERDELWRALRRLPLRQRTVLVMRFYADATEEEIAAALACGRGTVRSLASRGLTAVRSDPAISRGGAP
jgi:RNA polymerase sigma-70 factor (sigma-E family)